VLARNFARQLDHTLPCLQKYDLPVELLFDIVYRLAGHQSSLASLARVAQKHRQIAEEVLYDAPNLPDVFSNVSSARLFLQALLVKPDAVPRVKKLCLPIVKQHSAHSKDCIAPDRCVCGLIALTKGLGKIIDERCESLWADVEGVEWPNGLRRSPVTSSQPIGIILMILPNLSSLSIGTLERQRSAWDTGKSRSRHIQTTTEDCFGMNQGGLNTSAVPGLAYLRGISIRDAIDLDFLRSDILESLDVRMDLSDPGIPDMQAPEPEIVSTTVTRISL
jgi:hypothetical protein